MILTPETSKQTKTSRECGLLSPRAVLLGANRPPGKPLDNCLAGKLTDSARTVPSSGGVGRFGESRCNLDGLDTGHVVGVELNRGRLVSDVVASLPSEDAISPDLGKD